MKKKLHGALALAMIAVLLLGANPSSAKATLGYIAIASSDAELAPARSEAGKEADDTPPCIPAAPASNSISICNGSTAVLTAIGIGTLGWYDAPTGGNYLGGTDTLRIPALTANTTYYVQDSTSCGASATRTAVTVTILVNNICGTVFNNVLILQMPSVGSVISDFHTALTGNVLTITSTNSQNVIDLATGLTGISTNGTSTIDIDLATFVSFAGISVKGGAATDQVVMGTGGIDLSGTAGGSNQLLSIDLGSAADGLTVANSIKTKGNGKLYLQSGLGFAIDAPLVTLDTLTLITAGTLTQTAPISARTVILGKVGNTGTYTLTNAANATEVLRARASGALSYTDANALTVSNATMGGHVTISAQGALSVGNGGVNTTTGSGNVAITSTGSTVSVSGLGIRTNGNVTITGVGAISSGAKSINNTTGTGFISLTSTGGGVTCSGYGLQSKGAISITAAGNILFSGLSTSNSGGLGNITFTTTAGSIYIGSGGATSRGNITLTATGNITINSSGMSNSSGSGNISITSSNSGIDIGGQGISSKGNVTVNCAGNINSSGNSISNNYGTGFISITSTGGGFSASSQGLRSRRAISVNVAGNIYFGSISPTNSGGSGDITLITSSGTITPGSSGVRTSGNVVISAPGAINLFGGGVNANGNVSVTSSGSSISISAGGLRSNGNVTVSAVGAITVGNGGINNASGTGNIMVANTGSSISITDGGIKSRGDVTVNAYGALTLNRGGIQNNTGTGLITVKSATGSVTVSDCIGCLAYSGLFSNGNIAINSKNTILTGPVNSIGKKVSIQPVSAGTYINIGGSDASGVLGISNAELAKISADSLVFGDALFTDSILVSAAVPANTFNMKFITKAVPGGLKLNQPLQLKGVDLSGAVKFITAVTAGSTANLITATDNITLGTTSLLQLSSVSAGLLNGDKIKIINSDGANPVSGSFSGLAEGDTLSFVDLASLPIKFRISYVGGNGNDVELEVVGRCAFPDAPTSTGTTICNGASAVLTASGTGTLGWYDAAVGGNWKGGGSSFTTPALNSNATYYVQDSTCGASATRTAVAVTITNTKTWTGGNGNWNTGSNWCGGTVPSASDVIVISSGNPQLNVDFTVAGNLAINGTGSLTVNAGKTFTVSGTADFGGKAVVIKSDATGTGAIGQITGTLTGAGNVTVERYIATAKRAWRLLSIPVSGVTIRNAWAGMAANANAPTGENAGSGTLLTGHGATYSNGTSAAAAGYDWYSGLTSSSVSSIRFYNDATVWTSATNTPSLLNTPDKYGYFVFLRGDRTVTTGSGTTTLKPTGTLKTGTQTMAISNSYEVIGNPYASSIDLNAVYNNTGNSTRISRNFWVWDATLGTSGAYRALSWNTSSYDMTGGSGTAADYLKVQSGQAFFVQKTTAGNITIEESNKTGNASVVLMGAEPVNTVGKLSISLYQATGSTLTTEMDGVLARFGSAFQPAATDDYDVAKISNFNENLGLLRGNSYLSIESRPYPAKTDTLFAPFWNLTSRAYALKIGSTAINGQLQTARLVDAFTKTETALNLSEGGTITYPFSVTADAASSSLDRFMIVLTAAQSLPVSFTRVDATQKTTGIDVTWKTGTEINVKDYGVERSSDGLNFMAINSKTALNANNGAAYSYLDLQPLTGKNYYRIRSNDRGGDYRYSAIATALWNGKAGMGVFPTAIHQGQFTVQLANQPSGTYKLSVSNVLGRQLFSQALTHTGGSGNYTVKMGSLSVKTGVYQLTITAPDGQQQSFRLLISK